MKKSRGTPPCDVIKAMRVRAKLSQGELARILGINQSVLSKFENGGTKVPLPALLAIAHVCDFAIELVPKSKKGRRISMQTEREYERVGTRQPSTKRALARAA